MYVVTCLGKNYVFCWDVFIFTQQTENENLKPICAVATQLSCSTDGDSSQLPLVLDPQGSLPCLSGGRGGGGGVGFQEKHQPALQIGGLELLDHTAARLLAALPAPIVSPHRANFAKRGAGS